MTLRWFLKKNKLIILLSIFISLIIGIWQATNKKIQYEAKCYIQLFNPNYYNIISEPIFFPKEEKFNNTQYNSAFVNHDRILYSMNCKNIDKEIAKLSLVEWMKNIKHSFPWLFSNIKIMFVYEIRPNYSSIILTRLFWGMFLTFILISLIHTWNEEI